MSAEIAAKIDQLIVLLDEATESDLAARDRLNAELNSLIAPLAARPIFRTRVRTLARQVLEAGARGVTWREMKTRIAPLMRHRENREDVISDALAYLYERGLKSRGEGEARRYFLSGGESR